MDFEIVKIFLALIVLVNPFAALAIFLDITKGDSISERRKVATATAITVFVTITLFTVFGELLLKVLGISIGSFQVAGGILVFLIAINMMNGGGNPVKPQEEDVPEAAIKSSASAIVPLAIPIIIGPGGISTVVIYAVNAPNVQQILFIIAAGFFIAIFNYVILMGSARVSKFLGNNGLNILSRVMGLLLAAVAVEIAVSGIKRIFGLG